MDREAVANALKSARDKRKWSLGRIHTELARHPDGPASVPSGPTIGKYTTGTLPENPNLAILVPLARLFELDLDALGITEEVERQSDLLVRLIRCIAESAGSAVAA